MLTRDNRALDFLVAYLQKSKKHRKTNQEKFWAFSIVKINKIVKNLKKKGKQDTLNKSN